MEIKSVEKKGDLYYYTIMDDTGRDRVMECWHPVGMTSKFREEEALKYAAELFEEV